MINKSDEIKVVLYDKREFEAVIIGEDPLSDIAVIQILGDDLTQLNLGTLINLISLIIRYIQRKLNIGV